ncbi:MAG TPA: hypothetical protein VG164_14230 [Trebonia sp.]|jgi:hypothetical protein|nr:hypothetical protein [Trebonia sp.]
MPAGSRQAALVGVDRLTSELAPALAAVGAVDQAVTFERAVDEALTERTDVRCTALCNWDERRFGGGQVIEAVRAIHSVTVLPTPGALHVARTAGGLRVTGDSDLATRAEFIAALRLLEDLAAQAGPLDNELVLDISDLSFLDAYSAGAVLRLAAGLSPPRRLRVRCRGQHRRLLHVLGARSLRQLSIITDRLP